MAQRLPLPGPENFTLGLAGYGFLNSKPSQAPGTIPPVSRQLSFPQTELDVALAEQKRQGAVIVLLEQRLEEQEGGMVVTSTHVHPAEPSRPKKIHKRSRKSVQTRTTGPVGSERRTVFERLKHTPRIPPMSSRPRLASVVRSESSRSSATNSTAGTHRTGASGRTRRASQQTMGRSDGKRPMDLNDPPQHAHASECPEGLGQSRPITERRHVERHSAGSRGHHRTSSRDERSERENTIILYDQFTGLPTVY